MSVKALCRSEGQQWDGSPTTHRVGPYMNTCPPTSLSKRGDQTGEGERDRGGGWVRAVNQKTSNFSWQLEGAHLHILMHHSSASLYHSAKHYIYFANANLC